MLRLIDDQVDRLMRNLETSGTLRNTIVVYLADHGDYFSDYGLMRKGVELPEVLTRIPMVWAGPGVQPQKGQHAFVSIADVMPTLCEAMGAPFPAGTQGRSLWPLLRARTTRAKSSKASTRKSASAACTTGRRTHRSEVGTHPRRSGRHSQL